MYKKGNLEITKGYDKNEELCYWVYELPYYQNVKIFKNFFDAKNNLKGRIKKC